MSETPLSPPREYVLRPLGESIFNYQELYEERFIHYCRVCRMALQTGARSVLEIGPGDHLVTDFLRRKGVEVETMDNDPHLYPDHFRDIRHPWNLPKQYDAILAAEVFEHLPFRYLESIAEQAHLSLRPGGYFLVSLPYSTLRFFPRDKRYGKIQSPMGRLPTGIPFSAVQGGLSVLRGIYRFLILRYTWKGSFRPLRIHPPVDENDTSVHHWDAGYRPTDRKAVRAVFERRFEVVKDTVDTSVMNCLYLTLRRR